MSQLPQNQIKVWNLPGGVHPPESKTQSMQLPLGEVSLPSEMVFPVNQHIGAPAVPCVEAGQRVLAGEMIASPKGPVSATIHASTSGTIKAIEDRILPHPSGMSGPCIVLEPDGKDEWVALTPVEDYTQLEKTELLDKIRNAGIAGMGGAGFPAAIKLNPRATDTIDTLIINGTECEPYITADDMLMQTRADDIVAGTQLLAHLLGNPERVIIGIEDNKPDAICAVHEAAAAFNQAHGTAIQVAHFPTKYPSGGEKQLIQILTGKEVPSGQLPASIGIVLQNVGSTVAILEAVRDGKPLIERITTVVGESLEIQRNVTVRLGTPISHVLKEHGFDQQQVARLIMGGPMMGFALEDDDIPVVKTTNCVLAPSRDEMPDAPPSLACIRCGMCAEACPASLLPQQMYWYAQAQDLDRLEAHNIMDCIECGACSFVCPSNIPLVQYYRASKGAIRQAAIDKEKSDRSRQRFEFRQERIAKAEAEKEAKRLARKKAAEEAKKKLDAEKTNTAVPGASDVVAAAVASVQNKDVSPEEQKAKLERALASAQSRLEKAKARWEEAEDERKDQLEARVKQAEVKVKDAEAKLADFANADAPSDAAPAVDPNDPVAAAIARAQAKMSMAPDEKLRSSIESLQKRLGKAQEKLEAAKAEGADTIDALQAGVDKLQGKIADAEKELAELVPAQTSEPAPQEMDAATAAIERAKAKAAAQASMSPEEKLRDQVASLEKRVAKAEEKLNAAKAEGSDTVDALQTGFDKLQAKLEHSKAELAKLAPAAEPEPAAEMDAATAAIEKAKAKAAAQANMSDEEKLRDQVESLEKRLQKAQDRLAKAEADGDDNVDAFRTGAEKLEVKLAEAKEKLTTIS